MSYNDKQWSVFQGNKLRIEIFGASHAPQIGVKVKGLNGESFDYAELEEFMARRRAKKTDYSTKRLEADKVII